MEDIQKALVNRLNARKEADQLYEFGKLPVQTKDKRLNKELFIRYIIDQPLAGMYAYIRYLARINCAGCYPEFQLEGHDDGCCLDDSYAIDKYWRMAFESLDLEPVNISSKLKDSYSTNLNELLIATGIGEEDPLYQEKRLVDALYSDRSAGAVARYLLYRGGHDFTDGAFDPIYRAINYVHRLHAKSVKQQQKAVAVEKLLL